MKVINCENERYEEVYDLSVNHDDHSFILPDIKCVVHNSAFLIADRPIHEVVSLMNINGRPMRTSDTKISLNISKYMYAFSCTN